MARRQDAAVRQAEGCRTRRHERPAREEARDRVRDRGARRSGRRDARAEQVRLHAAQESRPAVEAGATVYTDDYSGYNGIDYSFTHHTINHSGRIYAEGHVHTQTIEGFFSLFKNGVRGVYHSVSPKWLQGYLNEYTWRYNRRDNGRAMFLDLIEAAASRTR